MKNEWKNGQNIEMAWVQCLHNGKPTMSFIRQRDAKNVQIIIYDIPKKVYIDAGQVPCFVDFSIEVRREGGGKTVAVDGVGQILKMVDDTCAFSKNLVRESYELSAYQPLWLHLEHEFIVVINGHEFFFFVDEKTLIMQLYEDR